MLINKQRLKHKIWNTIQFLTAPFQDSEIIRLNSESTALRDQYVTMQANIVTKDAMVIELQETVSSLQADHDSCIAEQVGFYTQPEYVRSTAYKRVFNTHECNI